MALLHVLTDGRVNWGAGRGFDPTEFEAFGVPLDETVGRFQEAAEVVLAAWANDHLAFHGRYLDFDHVEMLPKPCQLPGPPTRVAATSLDTVSSADSTGHLILMDPHASSSEIGAKYELYCSQLAAHAWPAPATRLRSADRSSVDIAPPTAVLSG